MVERWVSKALAVGPGLVVSTGVTSMVGAVLPPAAGFVLFVGGLLVAGVLLAGWGEAWAARLLTRSRPARPGELSVLAPAVTMLCWAGLGPPLVGLRVRDGERAVAAAGLGRRTVIVSSGLLAAVGDGTLPQDQGAAVIGHAAALIRGGWVRSDAVIAFWSLPWRFLHAAAMVVAGVGRRVPLTSFAWRFRGVVIAVAVVQSVLQGQAGLASLIGALGVVSYAMPVWERRWQQVTLQAGDRALADAGLAGPWVAFLRRCPSTPALRARIQDLDGSATPARSIGLVGVR